MCCCQPETVASTGAGASPTNSSTLVRALTMVVPAQSVRVAPGIGSQTSRRSVWAVWCSTAAPTVCTSGTAPRVCCQVATPTSNLRLWAWTPTALCCGGAACTNRPACRNLTRILAGLRSITARIRWWYWRVRTATTRSRSGMETRLGPDPKRRDSRIGSRARVVIFTSQGSDVSVPPTAPCRRRPGWQNCQKD